MSSAGTELQALLAKRQIPIHYGVEGFREGKSGGEKRKTEQL